jgi:hypothetical protein
MIIFHESSDGWLTCVSKQYNIWTILASISRYKYFYNKPVSIYNQEKMFRGLSLETYEKHKDEIKIKPVRVYSRVKIKLDDALKIKPKSKETIEHLNGVILLDLFKKLYLEEHGIVFVTHNDTKFENKFRKLMDDFYLSNLSDKHIRGYIKRAVKFGNHNGEVIYIEWLFNDNVVQNYLLVAKGLKDITAVWPYLDTSLVKIERKKIRYIMNIKRFEDFNNEEKDLCVKLYKRYDKKIYEKLSEEYELKNNFMAKEKLFELLEEEYNMTMDALLKQTKHDKKYFLYDYTKKQIMEAMKD